MTTAVSERFEAVYKLLQQVKYLYTEQVSSALSNSTLYTELTNWGKLGL